MRDLYPLTCLNAPMSADLVDPPALTYLESRLLAYRPETRDPVRFDLSPSTIEDHVWQDRNAYYCRNINYFRRDSWGENYTTLHVARRCRKIEDEHKGLVCLSTFTSGTVS